MKAGLIKPPRPDRARFVRFVDKPAVVRRPEFPNISGLHFMAGIPLQKDQFTCLQPNQLSRQLLREAVIGTSLPAGQLHWTRSMERISVRGRHMTTQIVCVCGSRQTGWFARRNSCPPAFPRAMSVDMLIPKAPDNRATASPLGYCHPVQSYGSWRVRYLPVRPVRLMTSPRLAFKAYRALMR